MEDVRLIDLVVRLGHEFKRRRMAEQLVKLRAFYRQHKAAIRAEGAFTAEDVVRWCCWLRIPPLDRVYELRSNDGRCRACGNAGVGATALLMSFPGGWAARCTKCGAVRLHES